MLRIIPYRPEHLQDLKLQPAQSDHVQHLPDPTYAKALAWPEYSITALKGDQVEACAGLYPCTEKRWYGWSLIGSNLTKREWVAFSDEIRVHLVKAHMNGVRRIETIVEARFEPGIIWAKHLGFKPEGYLRAYSEAGRDCYIFARVMDLPQQKEEAA